MKCENCKKEHNGTYGSGRFCSKKCSNSFSRKSDKQETKKVNCEKCRKEIEVDKRAGKSFCSDCGGKSSTFEKEIKKCLHCQKDLVGKGKTKFCCRSCFEIYKKENSNQCCKICGKITLDGREICNACNTRIRRFISKKKGIELLGGKCSKCGFDKNIIALEFHHKDDNKEFSISKIYNKSWNVVKNEIEKCILLCSNCHRIHHSKIRDDNFYKIVNDYGRVAQIVEHLPEEQGVVGAVPTAATK